MRPKTSTRSGREWYGWPDFASGIRLDDPHWERSGTRARAVIAHHRTRTRRSPSPLSIPTRGVNGFDFCRDPRFGFEGAFITLFGDIAPVTAHPSTPRGFKVVRVEMARASTTSPSTRSPAPPPSSRTRFERPSLPVRARRRALRGGLWRVHIAPEVGGIRMKKQTGTLWRIRRTDGPRGDRPPEPMVIPLHFLQNTATLVGIVETTVVGGLLIKRALSGGDAEPRTLVRHASGSRRKKKLLLAWLNDAYAMEKL